MKVSLLTWVWIFWQQVLSSKHRLNWMKTDRTDNGPEYKGTIYEDYLRDNKTGVPIIPS